jgi:hypothetical protein
MDAVSPLSVSLSGRCLQGKLGMKKERFVKALVVSLFAVWVWGGLSVGAAEIVYDNSDSANYLQTDYESTNEFGDEVILAGTARIVTEIQIEYYAQFTPSGSQLGRVRFYANTGPLWRGDPDYPTPASPPLYEQTFQLATNYQVAVIEVPNVVVPDDFTWTVQFLGISQTSTNDRAGLLRYGSPTVGQSFDDFWELLPAPDGWSPLGEDQVKYNFGARILAVSSLASAPSLAIARSGNNVVITWPTATGNFRLESKANLSDPTWNNVAQTPAVNGSNYQVTLPASSGNTFFRLESP